MKVYAIADTVPEGCSNFTAKKEYEVRDDGGSLFLTDDDNGTTRICRWIRCYNFGINWARVEREDTDCDCAELGIECRACVVTK